MSLLKRTWNLGNLLVIAGVVALFATFVWPYLTASRVARVESWAENIASRLLSTATELVLPDWADEATPQRLIDQMSGAEGERLSAVSKPEAAKEAQGLFFEGKHYGYAVLPAPEREDVGQPPAPEIEVYAWPLSPLGPGRTAFFFADGEPPAYTHNLHARYDGWRHIPRWGSAQAARRDPHVPGTYRAVDGERWIELHRTTDKKRNKR